MMQAELGELLVLGDYVPEAHTGPAIWLRCVVDRVLTDLSLPEDRAPILYLPGVAKQDLKAGDECREDLKPIVELMYRGTIWTQQNGNDWGVSSFLVSKNALDLDVSRDNSTSDALLRALGEVIISPVSQLSGRRLEAEDFNKLLSTDVIRDILRWMVDTTGTKTRLGDNGWDAFSSLCRSELDFDPEVEADITAGEKMIEGLGPWEAVWERFEESPNAFPGIVDLLRRSRPTDRLPLEDLPWPDLNDQQESAVRGGLKKLPDLSHKDACELVLNLEQGHHRRRDWVWAKIGLSPMANVLKPLSQLANAASMTIGGSTPDEVAQTYLERGWQGDVAGWEAIGATPISDEKVVSDAVGHLLKSWLNDSARAFQKAVENSNLPDRTHAPLVEAKEGVCILFTDGLRYDLGRRLGEILETEGCSVDIGHRWSALPSVTPTAKPAVSPVADQILGNELGEDFVPVFEESGKPAIVANLRSAMEGIGVQVLHPDRLDYSPESESSAGWMEFGDIDELGHERQEMLAKNINDELDRLANRIIGLFEAGWKAVRVVTDHGFLLLPGGLPRVDLPKYLTESRWARCAVLGEGVISEFERIPWHWNINQSFATAPGIACFNKQDSYAHGGLSIQECFTPDILVERGAGAVGAAAINSITWNGLRCFVEAEIHSAGVLADLRLDHPSGESVVASVKTVDADGTVSLLLADDEHLEAQLVLVLKDNEGTIIAHQYTKVGAGS
jgi:hypothetical protein